MTLTHKIYDDLRESLTSSEHIILSQQYQTKGGLSLVYALHRNTNLRSFYFVVNEREIDSIPACKGLTIVKAQLPKYSRTNYYCQIAQKAIEDSDIFEIIIEDIRRNVDEVQDYKKVVAKVSQVLKKWTLFFAQDKTVLLSPERQQGLYGELLFLSQLIELRDVYAVKCWTGCNYEVHDFYIGQNAVEIKTTSTRPPHKMHITSEQQLDNSQVPGMLLVDFSALIKSTSIGETLPQLVESIRESLADSPSMQQLFDKDLEEYGYFDGLEDKYATRYRISEGHTYCVSDGFPRLIPQKLIKGISQCTYNVSIDSCAAYEVSCSERKRILKGV